MAIRIRKISDSTNAGTRTFAWQIYDTIKGTVLKSATETWPSTITNHVVADILSNFLYDYKLANSIYTDDPDVLANTFILASDQATGANVTPVSLSGLSFGYEANSVYLILFMGRVQAAAATTGCGFQFDLSSVVTSIDVMFHHQLANAGTLTGGYSVSDDASLGVSSGVPSTAAVSIQGTGILRTGANAGTAQLRFRSEVAAVITAKAGLTMIVQKIN